MNGEALSSTTLRSRFAGSTELFAAVLLLRREPDDEIVALAARARADADTAIAAGRATTGDGDLAFRLLYEAARPAVSALDPLKDADGATRSERAFAALHTLRHRQRAALTLHYVLDRPVDAVGRVLGIRAGEVTKVLEAGVSALLKALAEPIDAPQALRSAGVRLIAATPHLEREDDAPEPARMPRAVFRTLLGPPPEDIDDATAHRLSILPGMRPMETVVNVLLAEEERHGTILIEPVLRPQAVPPAAEVPEVRSRKRPRAAALAIAAAFAVIVATALVPATAGDRPSPVSATVAAVPARVLAVSTAKPAATLVAGRLVVGRGDSLWAIAQRELGDGRRWGEIWRANRNQPMPSGTRFVNPRLIRPGWRLKMPGRA